MLKHSLLVLVLLLALTQASTLKQGGLAPGTYIVDSEIP